MKRSKKKDSSEGLEVIESRAAGGDIGSRENWVCCPQREPGVPKVRRFGTTTREIQALADWLHQEGVQTLALESTGTYWIPLYDVLEERGMEVLLVDARPLPPGQALLLMVDADTPLLHPLPGEIWRADLETGLGVVLHAARPGVWPLDLDWIRTEAD